MRLFMIPVMWCSCSVGWCASSAHGEFMAGSSLAVIVQDDDVRSGSEMAEAWLSEASVSADEILSSNWRALLHGMIADAQARAGLLEDAAASIKRIDINEGAHTARYLLMLDRERRGDVVGAISLLNEADTAWSAGSLAWFARHLESEGASTTASVCAQRSFEAASQSDTGAARVIEHLALYWAHKGDFDRARNTAVQERNAESRIELLASIGSVQAGDGDRDGARETLERARRYMISEISPLSRNSSDVDVKLFPFVLAGYANAGFSAEVEDQLKVAMKRLSEADEFTRHYSMSYWVDVLIKRSAFETARPIAIASYDTISRSDEPWPYTAHMLTVSAFQLAIVGERRLSEDALAKGQDELDQLELKENETLNFEMGFLAIEDALGDHHGVRARAATIIARAGPDPIEFLGDVKFLKAEDHVNVAHELARCWVRAGGIESAQAWIDSIFDPRVKAHALIGAASGVLERAE